jgi:hypothetical protein
LFDLKGSLFSWEIEAKNVFQSLKTSFTTTPIFIHADPSTPFVLEMDTSNFALVVILSQHGEDNLLHPVGFYSHKFFPIELTMRFMTKTFGHHGCF